MFVNRFMAAAAVIALCFCAFPRCTAEKTACQKLGQAYSRTKEGKIRSNASVYIYGRERNVIVYWDGRKTSRAAAALLIAALRHGLRYQRLRTALTNHNTICSLAFFEMQPNCTELDQSDEIFNNLYLIPAIGSKEGQCLSMEICYNRPVVPLRLQITGGSAAPLRLRMHVVLGASARSRPRCQDVTSWDFYKDRAALVECGFSSENESNPVATLRYFTSTPNFHEIKKTLSRRLNDTFLQYNILSLQSYKDLHHYVLNVTQSDNYSFLFLDYDIWDNVPGIKLVQPPPCSGANCKNELDDIRSVRVADVKILQQFAPHLLKVFNQFSPTPNQLREVIELEMKQSRDDIEEAACQWALNNTAVFNSWHQIEFKQQYWIAVFLCNNDPDKDNYKRTARRVEQFYKTTTTTKLYISVYFVDIDCFNESDLTNKFIRATMSTRWSYLIGAIGAGAGARMAAEYATQMETTLVLYDLPSAGVRLGPAVHTAGGTLNQLVIATRHFILSHKWKRLAIFSEETELAKDFVEALQRDKDLVIRNINLNANINIEECLLSLKTSNARIFFLNSISNVSKDILCSAQELGMTSSNGYVWILREWRLNNLKCANSLNLDQTSLVTISFWWQGQKDAHLFISKNKMIGENSFLNTLDPINDTQYLLPLTVPMADAIQILIKKFDIFASNFPSRINDIHGNGSERLVLKSFEEYHFDGELQKLNYINGALPYIFVFITYWNGNRPMPLSRWSLFKKEIKIDGEDCDIYKDNTPSDGSHNCLTTAVGDTFNPECQDVLWFAIGSFIFLLVFVLCLSWRKRIRNLAHHDSILRAQLLAKAEVISTSLVNHLIDRGSLDLNHDLGHGCFGRMRHGILRAPGRLPMIVAVKELLDDATPSEESELLREAVTLASLHHPNVVRLIGVCTTDGPLLVLMEYAFFGNLRDYLFERRHLVENSSNCADALDEAFYVSARSLTRLAREAVSALEYLSNHRLVHRDIRAANCLIDEQRSLKLGDFGLARTIRMGASGDDEAYLSQRRGLFPVRWMAPESLQTGVFTAASDVWAFGVLMLELTTLGARPYGSWPLSRVMRYVCIGGHPPLPRNILPELREMLLQCWQQAPEMRPTATYIAHSLDQNPSALWPSLDPTDPILDEECPVPYDNNPIAI